MVAFGYASRIGMRNDKLAPCLYQLIHAHQQRQLPLRRKSCLRLIQQLARSVVLHSRYGALDPSCWRL